MNANNAIPHLRPFFAVLLAFPAIGWSQSDYDHTLATVQSLLASQQFQKAAEESQRAIRIDGNRWEGYLMAATAYTGLKMSDDAIGYLQQALTHAPSDKQTQIRDMLGQLRSETAGSRPTPVSATSGSGTLRCPSSTPNEPPATIFGAEVIQCLEIRGGEFDGQAFLVLNKAVPIGAKSATLVRVGRDGLVKWFWPDELFEQIELGSGRLIARSKDGSVAMFNLSGDLLSRRPLH